MNRLSINTFYCLETRLHRALGDRRRSRGLMPWCLTINLNNSSLLQDG